MAGPRLSPSRANDFNQCPLLYRLRVIDRLPEPPSAAAARGTLVHAVLEHLFDLPASERTPAAAHARVGGAWEELVARRAELAPLPDAQGGLDGWYSQARRLLDVYFTLEDPTRLEPRRRELHINHRLADGLELTGIIDRVDVAPNGAVRIVDYKTGKTPRAGYGHSAAFQMRFYGLVWWREHGELPAALQLLYLGDGQVLRNTPTSEALTDTLAEIESVWSAITAAAEAGVFIPRRSRLCDWCSFHAQCPAFGGTPPALDPDAVERATGVRPAA